MIRCVCCGSTVCSLSCLRRRCWRRLGDSLSQLGSVLRLDDTRKFLMLSFEEEQYSQSLTIACGLCGAREVGRSTAMFFCCFVPVDFVCFLGCFASMGVRLTSVRDGDVVVMLVKGNSRYLLGRCRPL